MEVWWQDEARVEQQGTLTRMWAKCSTRPRAVRDHRFTSAYLFGAVCPERGTGAAMITPGVSIESMNMHLAEISCCVSPGSIALLILDRAGWHMSPKLKIPDNIALLPLPPYAPELNTVENIWAFLRGNILSHRVCKDYETVVSLIKSHSKGVGPAYLRLDVRLVLRIDGSPPNRASRKAK